jgi:hypothetical protein
MSIIGRIHAIYIEQEMVFYKDRTNIIIQTFFKDDFIIIKKNICLYELSENKLSTTPTASSPIEKTIHFSNDLDLIAITTTSTWSFTFILFNCTKSLLIEIVKRVFCRYFTASI